MASASGARAAVAFRPKLGGLRVLMSVHLILVLAQACFASLSVVGRLALRELSPMSIVLARVVGGAAVFWILAARSGPIRVERRDVPRLLSCALLGVVLNQVLFIHGLERSTATNATVLGTTIPVFTALFAVALGVERLRPMRAAGIAVALAGALVLLGVERFSLADSHAVGNLLILLNSCSYGLFLVVVRPLAERYRPSWLAALVFSFALGPAAALGMPSWIDLWPRLAPEHVAFLAFFVAVPTVGAYGLTQLALARADATLVAAYVYLQPVFAALGGAALLGERPTMRTLVAATLIFAGVYVSARRDPASVAGGASPSPIRPGREARRS